MKVKEQTHPRLAKSEAVRASHFSTSQSQSAVLMIIFLLVNVGCFAMTVVQITAISNIVVGQLDLTETHTLSRYDSGLLTDIF